MIVPTNSVLRLYWLSALLKHHPAKKVDKAVNNNSPRNRQSHQP